MSTAVNVVEMSYSAGEIRERVSAQRALSARAAQVAFSRSRQTTGAGRDFSGERRRGEPMLKVDQQLMWAAGRARLVRCGVQYAMTATGAREG